MPAYIFKRLVAVIPVLFGLSVIVFLVMASIPGDTATALLGSYATPENVERINRDLGLDKPLVQQYFIWIGNLLHGDFGRSFVLNRPVLDEVLERFQATLILAGVALVLCSFFGLFAVRLGRSHDHIHCIGWHFDPVILAWTSADLSLRRSLAYSSGIRHVCGLWRR